MLAAADDDLSDALGRIEGNLSDDAGRGDGVEGDGGLADADFDGGVESGGGEVGGGVRFPAGGGAEVDAIDPDDAAGRDGGGGGLLRECVDDAARTDDRGGGSLGGKQDWKEQAHGGLGTHSSANPGPRKGFRYNEISLPYFLQ